MPLIEHAVILSNAGGSKHQYRADRGRRHPVAWALWIEGTRCEADRGTGMRLTAPLLIERVGVVTAWALWIGSTSMRLIEVHG